MNFVTYGLNVWEMVDNFPTSAKYCGCLISGLENVTHTHRIVSSYNERVSMKLYLLFSLFWFNLAYSQHMYIDMSAVEDSLQSYLEKPAVLKLRRLQWKHENYDPNDHIKQDPYETRKEYYKRTDKIKKENLRNANKNKWDELYAYYQKLEPKYFTIKSTPDAKNRRYDPYQHSLTIDSETIESHYISNYYHQRNKSWYGKNCHVHMNFRNSSGVWFKLVIEKLEQDLARQYDVAYADCEFIIEFYIGPSNNFLNKGPSKNLIKSAPIEYYYNPIFQVSSIKCYIKEKLILAWPSSDGKPQSYLQ